MKNTFLHSLSSLIFMLVLLSGTNISFAQIPGCHAGFTYVMTGNTITFTDTSVYDIGPQNTTWTWDFGDGDTSTLQHPVHMYAGSPSVIFVCLTVTNCSTIGGLCCSDTHCETINFNQAAATAFYSSDTTWCDKKAIDYFDISTNSPTSWQWSFPGVVPNTSTLQNPTGIYYPSYGSFDVQLIACNSSGCDTLLMPAFVTELQLPPTPVVSIANDTLYSTAAFTYQWYDQNGAIPGAINRYFVPQLPGTYFVSISDSTGCYVSSAPVIIASVHESDAGNNFIISQTAPGEITVSFSAIQAGHSSIVIYDVAGRKIKSFDNINLAYGNQQIVLRTAGIGKGMYLIQMQSHTSPITKKLFLYEK